MKKIIFLFIMIILLIPICVNAEICDNDKITISSIAIDEKSSNVEELDEATVSGKNINLNLSMTDVGDSVVYKIMVKNDSNDDYLLDRNSSNISSDYIDYKLDSNDNSNLVKAKSTKIIYLTVQYKNKVPDSSFESDVFNDNITMKLNLTTDNTNNVLDTLKNPNTGRQLFFIILFLVLIITITIYKIINKKRFSKGLLLLIVVLIIVPISVCALCKCEIKVESRIKIEKKYSVYYVYPDWLTQEEVNNNEYYDIKTYDEYCADSSKWCMFAPYSTTMGDYSLYMITVKDNDYRINSTVEMKDYNSRYKFGFNENDPVINKLVTVYPYLFWYYADSYEKIDSMNFINDDSIFGVFYNVQEKPYLPFIATKVPQTFTMPQNDVTFYIYVAG